jgi:hypothetical protein
MPRMPKKKKPAKKATARRQKPRHAIDPIIRDRLDGERALSHTEPKEGYESLGFIKGLEWVLHQLEALRTS